jgi:hypothetical protein
MDVGMCKLLLLLLLLLRVPWIKRLIVGMVLLASSLNGRVRELLMLLLLLLIWAWLRHRSERVRRKVRVHVDSIVRAVLHVCGMFRQASRGYLDDT